MAAPAPPLRRSAAKPATPASPEKKPPQKKPEDARAPAVRAKLNVSRPTDPQEKDADRAADRVMRAASRQFPLAGPQPNDPDKNQKKVKRDAAGAAGPGVAGPLSAPSGFESGLARARQAGGTALPDSTRGFMESGYAQPFSQARMHHGGDAASLAHSIDARAFTIGSDVFFGAGQYQPHSTDGRRLIAHELAHVVQGVAGQVSAEAVSRADEKPAKTLDPVAPAPAGAAAAPGATGAEAAPEFTASDGARIVMNEKGKGPRGFIYLPVLSLPDIGGAAKGAADHTQEGLRGVAGEGRESLRIDKPFVKTGRVPRGRVTARQNWLSALLKNEARLVELAAEVARSFAPPKTGAEGGDHPIAAGGAPVYFLRRRTGSSALIVGTATEIAHHELVILPNWDRHGKDNEFDVDHMQELQLGGLDGWDNFCLLDLAANQDSGRKIFGKIRSDTSTLISAATKGGFWKAVAMEEPDTQGVVSDWQIRFEKVSAGLAVDGNRSTFWTRADIMSGSQLKGLEPLNEKEIAAAGLRFKPEHDITFINVYSSRQGGHYRRISKKDGQWVVPGGDVFAGLTPLELSIDKFTSVQDGHRAGVLKALALRGASKKGKVLEPRMVSLELSQSPNLGFGVYIDVGKQLQDLVFRKASPIVLDASGISAEGALFVEGRIVASIPLFSGLEIPFSIYGDRVAVSFPIPTDKLSLGPVTVTDAALEIGVGDNGLDLLGAVNFVLNGVGHGRLSAGVGGKAKKGKGAAARKSPEGGEGDGFSLGGEFAFDTDRLDPAVIGVEYRDQQFVVDATVGVKKGAVPGLGTAAIHVRSAPEGVLVDGSAELGVGALKGISLLVKRAEDGSILIGAENIPLPVDKIPGVRGATASVFVRRRPDTGAWALSGEGSAEIGIGGVTGALTLGLDGPLISIRGENLALHRGPLEGTGHFLVTNRPLDKSGQPVEGPPGKMAATGEVQATIALGPFLRGLIGGRVLPNGELAFSGGIAFPPTIDLFERKEFNRKLFEPPKLDIPIFGVTAAGQRIGIFATIGGSLSFEAGLGPGQLRDTRLIATLKPDHPENTTVAGHAALAVPADAGLRLEIHGGIGAGIPVVSAEAGIEIGGKLGVATEALAQVDVRWSPAAGLAVEANAHLHAQPQFTFVVTGYVKVTADVVITEFDIYSKKWDLKSWSFGPSLAFGVDFPVRWSEKKGLDFDVNKITVEKPDINIKELVSDMMHELV